MNARQIALTALWSTVFTGAAGCQEPQEPLPSGAPRSSSNRDPIVCAVAISGAFGITMLDLANYRIETMGLRAGLEDADVQRAKVLEELLFALTTGQDVVEWRLVRARVATFDENGWDAMIAAVLRFREELSGEQRNALWNDLRTSLRAWSERPWFALAVVDRANLERVLALDAERFFALLQRGSLARGDWFESRDEVVAYARVACPLLAVWGEEDDFLPPRRSSAWLRANLAAADDVTLRVIPGGDHSLLTIASPGRYVSGYPQLVVDWLRDRFGVRGAVPSSRR